MDWTSIVSGILEGDKYQLNYQTILTKPYQEKSGDYSWRLWRRILKILTPSPKITTDKQKKRLGKWIDSNNECGKWLSYQDRNGNFYTRESHKDKEWIVYKRTNKGSQLTCIIPSKNTDQQNTVSKFEFTYQQEERYIGN